MVAQKKSAFVTRGVQARHRSTNCRDARARLCVQCNSVSRIYRQSGCSVDEELGTLGHLHNFRALDCFGDFGGLMVGWPWRRCEDIDALV